MKKFNDMQVFEKELADLIFELLSKDIKEMLEFVIDTHDIKPLQELVKILKSNRY